MLIHLGECGYVGNRDSSDLRQPGVLSRLIYVKLYVTMYIFVHICTLMLDISPLYITERPLYNLYRFTIMIYDSYIYMYKDI